MPLDVARLMNSDLVAVASGEEFRAAVLLWCKSWHQVPAASLPNDDRMLAHLAGFGRDLKAWGEVKEMALRGFVLCDDGRLYHPVIAEKAIEAIEAKRKRRERTAAATEARKQPSPSPNDERNVQRDYLRNVHQETGTVDREEVREGGRDAPGLPATVNRDAALAFDAFNDLAAEIGLPKAQALTTGRRKKITARLDECGGLIGWQDALAKIRGSPFLRGDNDRGWRADLDFILQASSFTKLMEGSYDRTTVQRAAAGGQNNTIAGGFDLIDRAIEQRERELAAAQDGPGRGENDPFEVPRLRQVAP